MMLYFEPEFSRDSRQYTWDGYNVVDVKTGSGIHRHWMGCELNTYTNLEKYVRRPPYNSVVRTTRQKFDELTKAVTSGNVHMLDTLVRHLFYLDSDKNYFPKTPVRQE